MPLKTPFSATNKSDTQPKGKAGHPPIKGKGASPSPKGKDGGKHPTPQRGKSAPPPQPEPAPPSWWETLSPERKLDVVGAVMAVVGLLTVLILFSAQRSAVTRKHAACTFGQIFGWGIYILPVGLILMGLWLILRRIEKLPPLSLERATGIIFFFFWLLTSCMPFMFRVVLADQAALEGVGGGYIGSFFERVLFNSLGTGGAWVALLAWLLITMTMVFDIYVEDLFRWVNPVMVKVRAPAGEAQDTNKQIPPIPRNRPMALQPLIVLNPSSRPATPVAPVTTVKTAGCRSSIGNCRRSKIFWIWHSANSQRRVHSTARAA